MKLSQLISEWTKIDKELDCDVSGLTLDSRKISAGDVFFACKGESFDGRDFIDQAIAKNAAAIVCEKDEKISVLQSVANVPVVPIENLNEKISFMASHFFGEPSKKMSVIGVTGTNGKTSITQFIAQAFNKAGLRCGVMGTLGFGFPGAIEKTEHTTVDAVSQQAQLHHFNNLDTEAVAMEVSSHGLAQDRVSAVTFDTAVFTNLSHDHLDYHGDMASYWEAKKKLFDFPGLKHAVINCDDPHGFKLYEELKRRKEIKCIGYSLERSDVEIYAKNVACSGKGVEAYVKTPWGEGELTSHLLGRFNLSNVLAVLGVLCLKEVSLDDAIFYISQLGNVPGRMQKLGGQKQPLVVIDFAHTPDALEKALSALREHCGGKLWCVFGCGGDRDQKKRPVMGEVAERLSDQVIITDDNPRTENGDDIIKQITSGLLYPWAANIERDRSMAIAKAIEQASVNDVVLIAGKGHEMYQDINGERKAFSDEEEVRRFLI